MNRFITYSNNEKLLGEAAGEMTQRKKALLALAKDLSSDPNTMACNSSLRGSNAHLGCLCMYVGMCICMHVCTCMYVCMHVYVYMYA